MLPVNSDKSSVTHCESYYVIHLGISSLQHVFDSLTDNGKGVLKLIVKEQIEQIKQRKEGPSFKGKCIKVTLGQVGTDKKIQKIKNVENETQSLKIYEISQDIPQGTDRICHL